jgi:hypothetical protein
VSSNQNTPFLKNAPSSRLNLTALGVATACSRAVFGSAMFARLTAKRCPGS